MKSYHKQVKLKCHDEDHVIQIKLTDNDKLVHTFENHTADEIQEELALVALGFPLQGCVEYYCLCVETIQLLAILATKHPSIYELLETLKSQQHD